MSHEQAQRLSERWFRFALWIIAVVFAGFLIGLGGTLVKNLPLVEQSLQSEDFIDRPAAEQTRQEIERQRQAEAKPDAERRQELPYDTALARLAKRVSARVANGRSSWTTRRSTTARTAASVCSTTAGSAGSARAPSPASARPAAPRPYGP